MDLSNLPKNLKKFRTRQHAIVDEWCVKQAEIAKSAREGQNLVDVRDSLQLFDEFLEEEQQHQDKDLDLEVFDVLRMQSADDPEEETSINIVEAEELSEARALTPPRTPDAPVRGVFPAHGFASCVFELDVRRDELHKYIRELLEEEHHLTSLYLTTDKILCKRGEIAARRRREKDEGGLVIESLFDETSSVDSSIDEYSDEDSFSRDDPSFGYWDTADEFVQSNTFPGVTFQDRVSAMRFEATHGIINVSGYVFGPEHPKYKNIAACINVLKHNLIHRPHYDFPLVNYRREPEIVANMRGLLRRRISPKRVVFQEKVGISLNKALSTAHFYGITRFLRDFFRQLFEIVAFVHQKGFVICNLRPKMFRVLMTKALPGRFSDKKNMTLIVSDLTSFKKCGENDFVEVSNNIFFIKQNVWSARPPSASGTNGTFNYSRKDELFAMGLFLKYFGMKHDFFKPSVTPVQRKEAYLNQRLTYDMHNRLTNMMQNIAEGKLGLPYAKDHVFFLTCRQTLTVFRDLSDRLSLALNKKHAFPAVSMIIDNSKLEFDAKVFGANSVDWEDAVPMNIKCYIEGQRTENTAHRAQQTQQRSAGGSVSTSYSTASFYGSSAYDLVKFIRNHDTHFYNKGNDIRATLGERPRKYLDFFVRRFPALATQSFVLYNRILSGFALDTLSQNLSKNLKNIEYSHVPLYTPDAVDGFVVYNIADDDNDA